VTRIKATGVQSREGQPPNPATFRREMRNMRRSQVHCSLIVLLQELETAITEVSVQTMTGLHNNSSDKPHKTRHDENVPDRLLSRSYSEIDNLDWEP
jgi:hypothetical protein